MCTFLNCLIPLSQLVYELDDSEVDEDMKIIYKVSKFGLFLFMLLYKNLLRAKMEIQQSTI